MAFVVGLDSSGNQNDWSSTNMASQDSSLDTPSNNFCTLNSETGVGGNNTYSQGNLRFTNNSTTGYADGANSGIGTMVIDTSDSKGWYWELRMESLGREDLQWNGIIKDNSRNSGSQDGDIIRSFSWNAAGKISVYQPQDNTNTADTTSPATGGAHIGIALKNNKMWVRMNGTWYGDPAANTPSAPAVGTPLAISISDGHWLPHFLAYGGFQSYGAVTIVVNFGQNPTFNGQLSAGGNSDAKGYGNFKYSVPSGFLALCSKNLPDPTIKKPEEYFNPVLYTGNATARAITVGFQPDFVWTKNRNSTWAHLVQDSVRGATKELRTNETIAENTEAQSITAFSSTGYSLGTLNDYNANTYTFVSWNWKAGGAPTADNSASAGATPTAGSVKIDGSNLGSALAGTIAATRLSANTTSAFSITKYTGNDTAGATVAHGLGVAPDLVIIKNLTKDADTGRTWDVTSPVLGTTGDTTGGLDEYYILVLNDTPAKADYSQDNIFGFTSTTFSIGSAGAMNEINNSSYSYIAYCFADVEGYSKVGTYTGNGNADGTFVYTSFRPAYVLAKRTDSTSSWYLYDNKRPSYNQNINPLYPNGNWAEGDNVAYAADLLSNGFKWRNADGSGMNVSSATYIYMAFAEFPFKYSNAR